MTIPTTTVGFGSSTVSLGKVGHGLMNMTWTTTPVSDEQAFESIKTSLDSVPAGSKMLINSGEFYGVKPREANLELIARFFEKYPTYTEKAFLSVKGGVKPDSLEPDSSSENLKRSVDNILAKLRGTKKLDLFECARVDHKVPLEDAIRTLAGFVEDRKFDFIGMSECKAETLRRAHAVHPIAIVEIEVSPWQYDDEVKKVVAASNELGVAIAAYSPLGWGFLAGKFKSLADLKDGDPRKMMARFQEENLAYNKAIAEGMNNIAAQKGVTPAQLCIAWVTALGDKVIPIPGSSKASRTQENTSAANIKLTADEVGAIDKVLDSNPVRGGRYFGPDVDAHLWG